MSLMTTSSSTSLVWVEALGPCSIACWGMQLTVTAQYLISLRFSRATAKDAEVLAVAVVPEWLLQRRLQLVIQGQTWPWRLRSSRRILSRTADFGNSTPLTADCWLCFYFCQTCIIVPGHFGLWTLNCRQQSEIVSVESESWKLRDHIFIGDPRPGRALWFQVQFVLLMYISIIYTVYSILFGFYNSTIVVSIV